jgi:hypothetical protein
LDIQAHASFPGAGNSWRVQANQQTCAATSLPYGNDGKPLPPTNEARCFTNETFAFAEHLCVINGARLCTKFELETVAKGTGLSTLKSC